MASSVSPTPIIANTMSQEANLNLKPTTTLAARLPPASYSSNTLMLLYCSQHNQDSTVVSHLFTSLNMFDKYWNFQKCWCVCIVLIKIYIVHCNKAFYNTVIYKRNDDHYRWNKIPTTLYSYNKELSNELPNLSSVCYLTPIFREDESFSTIETVSMFRGWSKDNVCYQKQDSPSKLRINLPRLAQSICVCVWV